MLLGKFAHAGVASLIAVGMVGHILGLLIVASGVGDAVFQHEGGDAVGGEPPGHVGAFLVPGQRSEAATGADDDRGAGLCALRREIDPDLRVHDVQDAFTDLAGVHCGRVLEKILLLGPILGTGSLAFVETDLFRLSERNRADQHEDEGY